MGRSQDRLNAPITAAQNDQLLSGSALERGVIGKITLTNIIPPIGPRLKIDRQSLVCFAGAC